MKIILFEDTAQFEGRLVDAITKALGNRGRAESFKPSSSSANDGTYDKRLENDLISAGHQDATLIVADRDLSKLVPYGGLSEPIVRMVADRLGIPECAYARGDEESKEFLEDTEFRENRIGVSLQGGDERFAHIVVSIAAGFATIKDQLPNALSTPGRKSPGKLLASILEKPEYAEKIALYASGDQNRLASLPLHKGDGAADPKPRVACSLGYWLWDSVLRFPGIVVNTSAAASYLNIKEDAFVKLPETFAAARYKGPFYESRPPLWWRGMLDDMIAGSGAKDGLEYAQRITTNALPPSQCCEDPTKSAGYYCMLSGRPVSLENSKNGLTWFPRGADLARISNSKYAEIVPWL